MTVPNELELTKRFRKVYRKKTPDEQGKLDRTLRLLVADPQHPGLNTHRVLGTRGVWECYIDDSMRITFEYGAQSTLVVRNNCQHNAVLREP